MKSSSFNLYLKTLSKSSSYEHYFEEKHFYFLILSAIICDGLLFTRSFHWFYGAFKLLLNLFDNHCNSIDLALLSNKLYLSVVLQFFLDLFNGSRYINQLWFVLQKFNSNSRSHYLLFSLILTNVNDYKKIHPFKWIQNLNTIVH